MWYSIYSNTIVLTSIGFTVHNYYNYAQNLRVNSPSQLHSKLYYLPNEQHKGNIKETTHSEYIVLINYSETINHYDCRYIYHKVAVLTSRLNESFLDVALMLFMRQ